MDRLETTAALLDTLDRLREECPWDRKQTIESLRDNTIEECYELVDAINSGDFVGIKEELGDLLLHVAFYSKIASEKGEFTFSDVAKAVDQKLIYRHPHVFGELDLSTSDEVVSSWEAIKQKERAGKGVLSGVPSSLPPLVKAFRVQQKASAVGFDWDEPALVFAKVKEEIAEVEAELTTNNKEALSSEIGDALFALVNLARKYDINPSDSLEGANKKFMSRFNYIESQAAKAQTTMQQMNLDQMEQLWNEAKQIERK